MKKHGYPFIIFALIYTIFTLSFIITINPFTSWAESAVSLPEGVQTVWDMDKAFHETTPTREWICINGLWQFQPSAGDGEKIPADNWGYFKVPAPWPSKTGDYMWRETQTIYPHPSWQAVNLDTVKSVWYQREITIRHSGPTGALSLRWNT